MLDPLTERCACGTLTSSHFVTLARLLSGSRHTSTLAEMLDAYGSTLVRAADNPASPIPAPIPPRNYVPSRETGINLSKNMSKFKRNSADGEELPADNFVV